METILWINRWLRIYSKEIKVKTELLDLIRPIKKALNLDHQFSSLPVVEITPLDLIAEMNQDHFRSKFTNASNKTSATIIMDQVIISVQLRIKIIIYFFRLFYLKVKPPHLLRITISLQIMKTSPQQNRSMEMIKTIVINEKEVRILLPLLKIISSHGIKFRVFSQSLTIKC